MHILIVTQYFWPETFLINNVAIDLIKNGHEVTVLTGIPNYPQGSYFSGYGIWRKKNENYHGVNIKRVPLISRGKGHGLKLVVNYLSFAFFATVLSGFRCRKKYDVIFVFMPSPITVGLPALFLKKLKKAPILFWVQDLWPDSLSAVNAVRSAAVLRWIGKLTQFIYRHCDRILVQSRAFIPSVKKLGVAETKIHYLPNPVDEFNYQMNEVEFSTIEKMLPTGFRIMYGGNIGAAQSFATILQAAIILKDKTDIHWIVIGDGREKDWLSQQIVNNDLQNTLHLIEKKPPEQMPYYFSLADALLVSLKKDPVFSLTIPSKLQTYMRCGRPIIAALDGEAARIVEESATGVISAAEDAQSLANNVLTLYNMQAYEREKMGQNGKAYFEQHFDRQHLLNQLQKWMQEVTGKI
jgi:colanic acid biosynthesis glycosyl transferase WcaI